MSKTKIDRLWRCDCGAGHFLSVTWYPGDLASGADVGGRLDIEGDFHRTFRRRLALAWRILRTGHAETSVGVILDVTKAEEIAATLEDFADAPRGPRPPREDNVPLDEVERDLGTADS